MRRNAWYVLSFALVAVMGLNSCDDDSNSKSQSCLSKSDCPDGLICGPSMKCELPPASTCNNYIQDANETDIDCGGTSSCGKCAVGKNCKAASDCGTNVCTAGKCANVRCENDVPCTAMGGTCDLQQGVCISCSDGMKNGSETDVDCGGTCANKCAGGKGCQQPSDCASGGCESNLCVAGSAPAADLSQIVINEVMGSPVKSQQFDTADVEECEFVEILNRGNTVASMDGISLYLLKDGDDPNKAKKVELSGAIQPRSAMVVAECEEIVPIPADVVVLGGMKLSMTNGAGYELWLGDGSVESLHIYREGHSTKDGISQNLPHDGETTAEALVPHNTVSATELLNSPGYCSNGGTFSKNCTDAASNGNEEPECEGDDCEENHESNVQCSAESPCPNGQICNEQGKCVTEGGSDKSECDNVDISGLVINEVMKSSAASKTFKNSTTNQCEFIEILNTSDKSIDGKCVTVNWQRDSASSATTADLNGTIPAHGVCVLTYEACASIDGVPSDVRIITHPVFKNANVIVNSGNYSFWLSNGDDVVSEVQFAGEKSSGKSMRRDPEISGEFEKEDDPTPGLCSNGNTFASGCTGGGSSTQCDAQTPCPNGQICNEQGKCVTSGGDTQCDAQNPCPNGQICNEQGKCVTNGNETSGTKADGEACEKNSDCQSGKCNQLYGICMHTAALGEDCSQDECKSGLYCNTEKKCAKPLGDVGDDCVSKDDCLSGLECKEKKCASSGEVVRPDCVNANAGDLKINEILNNVDTSGKFADSDASQFEFIEIHNNSMKKLNLSNLTLSFARTSGTGDLKVDLKDSVCLDVDQYLVIMSSDNTFPESMKTTSNVVLSSPTIKAANWIVNSASYNVILRETENESKVIHQVSMEKADASKWKGVSAALPTAGVTNEGGFDVLVPHNTLGTKKNSSLGKKNFH